MRELSILGASHLSDFYPNVKYKIQLISGLATVNTRLCLHDLGNGGFYRNLRQVSLLTKALSALRLGLATLFVFLRFLGHRTELVYITYPAPALAVLLGLLPQRWRPVIHIDAFISLYDTVVHDRALLRRDSWQAKLLFHFERRAFAVADYILVDTEDNAHYYAQLFGLPRSRFQAVPLSIPPLQDMRPTDHDEQPANGAATFTCLFVGSLVPLHGIQTILEAAQQLSKHSSLRFVIIGDGQEAWRIEEFLQQNPNSNLTWQRGMQTTDKVVAAITAADLCLGIFGTSDKAQRVLPYKIYYYAALAKPFVTRRTPCLEHYCQTDQHYFLTEGGPAASQQLAGMIERYLTEKNLGAEAAVAASNLYRKQLGPDAMTTTLNRLFAQGKTQ